MTKPILVWFGFPAVVRYQILFLEEAKDIFKFLSGTLQSKGPLKIAQSPITKILVPPNKSDKSQYGTVQISWTNNYY